MQVADRSTALPMIRTRPTARRDSQRLRSDARHRQWFDPRERLRDLISGLSLMSASSFRKQTATVSKRIPFSASLQVAPAIATVNAPRVLTITAYFPLGRGPTDASVARVSIDGLETLEIRLDSPSPDFAFSDLVLVPYTVTLTYAPTETGDLPVRMLTSDNVPVGESVVVTRRARGDHAQFDVTGRWIDPASHETGLAFVPESPPDNHVVGTWNFHDHQGECHRYSIQSVHWRQQDVEAEGAIYETTAWSATAPSTELAMPPLVAASQLGLARITFHGLNSARIFALGFGGNVLFTSNLVRTTF